MRFVLCKGCIFVFAGSAADREAKIAAKREELMIDKNQADYLYVLRSVVRGEHPDQGKIVRMDQEAVFQIAFRQTTLNNTHLKDMQR